VKLVRWCGFALLVLLALPIAAQTPEPAAPDNKDAAESRATAFEAVEGPQKEEVPGGSLLIGAYAFVLVLVVGYVARLASMQSKTAAEVERLTRAIERGKTE
jgi:hypothetical protein